MARILTQRELERRDRRRHGPLGAVFRGLLGKRRYFGYQAAFSGYQLHRRMLERGRAAGINSTNWPNLLNTLKALGDPGRDPKNPRVPLQMKKAGAIWFGLNGEFTLFTFDRPPGRAQFNPTEALAEAKKIRAKYRPNFYLGSREEALPVILRQLGQEVVGAYAYQRKIPYDPELAGAAALDAWEKKVAELNQSGKRRDLGRVPFLSLLSDTVEKYVGQVISERKTQRKLLLEVRTQAQMAGLPEEEVPRILGKLKGSSPAEIAKVVGARAQELKAREAKAEEARRAATAKPVAPVPAQPPQPVPKRVRNPLNLSEQAITVFRGNGFGPQYWDAVAGARLQLRVPAERKDAASLARFLRAALVPLIEAAVRADKQNVGPHLRGLLDEEGNRELRERLRARGVWFD